MKPFIVLITTFIISLLGIKLFRGTIDIGFSARISMSVMLVFTSIAHFVFTKGMAMMIPAKIPFKTLIVYTTGIIEIIAAITLLIPSFTLITAWFLIGFFILLLPANVNAAIKHIDYQKGNFDGNGAKYLWFRIPLQVLFILWVYYSCIQML